jgi:hypothetical protein
MLKKEFRDTLRLLLESSVLLLAIPMTLVVTLIFQLDVPAKDLIQVISILTALLFAAYSGIALFRTERRDKGFEYLFSLPLSRLKIFLFKLIPRVVVLLVLSGILLLAFDLTLKGIILPLILLQLAGVFISLAFDSYFLSFCAMILLGFFFTVSSRFSYYGLYMLSGEDWRIIRYINPSVVALLLLGIPLSISFAKVLKNLDLKPYKYSIKPYLQFMMPVLLIHMLVFFMFYEKLQQYFF